MLAKPADCRCFHLYLSAHRDFVSMSTTSCPRLERPYSPLRHNPDCSATTAAAKLDRFILNDNTNLEFNNTSGDNKNNRSETSWPVLQRSAKIVGGGRGARDHDCHYHYLSRFGFHSFVSTHPSHPPHWTTHRPTTILSPPQR